MTQTIRTRTQENSTTPIDATRAMWYGVAFSAAFTVLIYFIRPLLPQFEFLPDTGFSFYVWQLPNPTAVTRASAWIGYLAHQVAFWWLIYIAQRDKTKYSRNLHRVNILALGMNAFFIVLHLLQTMFWYDGLAQDVSILSSQGSVILLLVMVLLMENQRRGLFFGKKIKALTKPAGAVRTYHGYVFAWAAVYTFWYHPMENTFGHLVGFFYMFFLLLQGSLFFTRIHVNKYWTFFQEFLVLIHGTLVAIESAWRLDTDPFWSMFFFGFATLVVVTQMWGLDLPSWANWAVIISFIAFAIYTYNGNWSAANEIIRIPVIEYGLVFVLAGLIWLGGKIRSSR